MSNEVPDAKTYLSADTRTKQALQLTLNLQYELQVVTNRTKELASLNERAQGYLSLNTSQSTRALRSHAIKHLGSGSSSLALSVAEATQTLQTLSDKLSSISTRRNRLVKVCEEALMKLRSGVASLRQMSGTAGLLVPQYWQDEVPLSLPSSCVEVTNTSVSGMMDVAEALKASEEDWYWTAVTHNSLLHEIAEHQRAMRDLKCEQEESEHDTAGKVRRASEQLSQAQNQLRTIRSVNDFDMNEVVGPNQSALPTASVNSSLTPQEVNDAWVEMGLQGEDAESWVKAHPFVFAGLNGIPLELQQLAAEEALRIAVNDPQRAYIALGFAGTGLTLQKFIEHVTHLQKSIQKADRKNPHLVHQLVSLGRHHDSVTAVVSTGDLKSAERVTVVVPGMFSNVGNIETLIGGADNIQNEALKFSSPDTPSSATVAFMGYDSPGLLQEMKRTQAMLGAHEINRFLTSLHVEAEGSSPPWVALTSHSYASLTSSEALWSRDTSVQTFTSIGSAGLSDDVTRGDLAVEKIYAISADPPTIFVGPLKQPSLTALITAFTQYDAVAPMGQITSRHGVDPRTLEGAITIPNSEGPNRVSSHAIWTETGAKKNGYLSENTPSLEMIGRIHVGAEEAQ